MTNYKDIRIIKILKRYIFKVLKLPDQLLKFIKHLFSDSCQYYIHKTSFSNVIMVTKKMIQSRNISSSIINLTGTEV